MLQLLEIKEIESYIQLVSKLNKNFDIIALSSGGNVGPQGPFGPRGLLGPNGLRGIRFFNENSDLTESIKGDWLIFDDGSVKYKDSLGNWILISNFNLKGPIGLQGISGETSELTRYNGILGDSFNSVNSYVPELISTTSLNFVNKNFITLKKSQDTLILGSSESIKNKIANFPSENEISSLIIVQNDLIPNGKNGISIGSINLKNSNTPILASSDYNLFGHLWIDDDGSFKILKDFGSLIISSNESVIIGSELENILIGNDNGIRTININGNKIELTSIDSLLKVSDKIEIKTNSLNPINIISTLTPLTNDVSSINLIQGSGNVGLKIKRINYIFNSNFGDVLYKGSLGVLNVNAPNETTSINGIITSQNKDIYFTKEGSIYLGETSDLAFGSSLYDRPGSLYVGGQFKLNKNQFPDFDAKLVPLSDIYGRITLYDENGSTGINNQVDNNGFQFGPFYKSKNRNAISLLTSKLEIGKIRDSTELFFGITVKSTTDIAPSILLSSDQGYNPYIEFKKNDLSNNTSIKTSKSIRWGHETEVNRVFELPQGTGSISTLATLSDPLNQFSDSWRLLKVKRNSDNSEIENFFLSKMGGLTSSNSVWFKEKSLDANFFNNLKCSSGRDFQSNGYEHLTPYSRISLQRLNKEIWFLQFSITIVRNSDFNESYENTDFFEIEINDRIGVLKPIKNDSDNLDFDGQTWFPCSIYNGSYINKSVSTPVNWDNGVKKFVRNELNHQNLNSNNQYKGVFTMDRIGNNKTAIQFSFEPIENLFLNSGIVFTGSCLCYGYREQEQDIETFDSNLYLEEK